MATKRWEITFAVVLSVGAAIVTAGVLIPLLILISKEKFYEKPATLPTSLHVSENEGDVTIQWAQTVSTYNGSYLLQYSINGGKQIKVYTTGVEYTVVKPPVCSDMFIQIQTVSETGDISKRSLTHYYTVLPLNAFVTDTTVTRTDTGIVVSWKKPTGLETCDISYVVKCTSELGQLNTQTISESIIVPEDIFCVNLQLQISSVIGSSKTWFGEVVHINDEKFVVDLSIPSENPFVLIATWRHRSKDICSLSYAVTYEFGLESKTSVVLEPRVTFDIRYCVFATLTILPSAFDGEYTGRSSIISATQYPTNMVLQPVENVEFIMDDIFIAISWDVPDSLSLCSNLYTVTARNDYLDEEGSCKGTSGCVVILNNVCPSTEFTISPRTLQGESVHKTYSC